MSADLAFSKNRRPGQLLLRFLDSGHALFAAEPGRLLGPLIRFLREFHQSGQAHGAVMPGRLLVLPGGDWDLEFFKNRAGSPDALELEVYYPDGGGATAPDLALEIRQRRDIRALAAVVHLIITDHPPARRTRRVRKLADHPLAQAWPAAFIGLVDRVLDAGPDDPLTALTDWMQALGVEEPPMPPAVAVPPASDDGLPSVPLPNGMMGRPYAVELPALEEFAGGAAEGAAGMKITGGLPEGLHFDDGLLTGTPRQAGEFEIVLHLPSAGGGSPAGRRMLQLMVNPSPQSLWKNLPSDPGALFARPDTDTRFLTGPGSGGEGRLTVIGASRRGRSHAHVGGFRDDDLGMAWHPGSGWYVLTVADGAGSARFSREGARTACAVVQAYFSELEKDGAGESLAKRTEAHAQCPDDASAAQVLKSELCRHFEAAALLARRSLEATAQKNRAELRDFHTTLITVLLHPLADGQWFAAAFSIGDGAAAVIGLPGAVSGLLLTRADSGEFAGQTVFLTLDQSLATPEAVAARVRMAVLPGFKALFLVTDGVSDPWFPSDTALADPAGWSRLWGEIQPLLLNAHDSPQAQAEALLHWMEFHSPGHHDDRTMVLAMSPLSLSSPAPPRA
ncbi:MAG: protein phosphatase protein [Verrucomicrobiales bacterium]|nr:protein phosphatase protein [Verrucomicrobiales bacterium]